MIETVNAVEAWLGSLPGHVYANVRQPPISTLNLAHMIPLSAVWPGGEGPPFQGSALVPGQNGGIDPVSLLASRRRCRAYAGRRTDRRRQSVLLALMALQFRRYPESQILRVRFWLLRTCRHRCHGWRLHDIGGVLSGESAEFVELQPLAAIDDPSERGWAAEWIAAILGRRGSK